jgi:hypothetical protein
MSTACFNIKEIAYCPQYKLFCTISLELISVLHLQNLQEQV